MTGITQRRFVSGPELVANLLQGPVVTSIQEQNWVAVYKLTIPALAAGQCLIVHAEVEVTTGYTTTSGVNPEIVSQILLNGTPIDRANGTNVTPAQHHWVEKRSCTYQAQENMTNVVLEFGVFASHDLLKPPEVALVVQPGSGWLEATIV